MATAAIPIIGAVGSVIGGILGSNGARAAGHTLADAGTKAASTIGDVTNSATGIIGNATQAGQAGVASATQGGQQTITAGQQAANNMLQNVYLSQLANLQPYQAAGAQGVNGLAAAMQPGGSLAGTFQAPTLDQVEQTPGYQFQLKTGTQAIEQNAAAAGLLGSGGTLKGLEQYGQGLASTTYQQAYNNALQSYQTNFNNQFNSLSALAGMGLTSTGMANNAASNFGNLYSSNTMAGSNAAAALGLQGAENISNTGMQGASLNANTSLEGTIAAMNAYMQGQQGWAGAQAGSAQAWQGALNGVTGSLGKLFAPGGLFGSSGSGGGTSTVTGAGVSPFGG